MPPTHKSSDFPDFKVSNPFLEGQDRAYADILDDKIKEMKWWRTIIGSGFLALFAASLVLFFISISRQQTVPVLVNVMPTGEAQYLGEVRQGQGVQVPEAAIQYQARKFITNLRSVSTDADVLYNNFNELYSMITAAFEPVLTNSIRTSNPFDLVGKTRRTVEFESVLKITGSSYQLDWYETLFEAGSASEHRIKMRGIVTIALLPVTDKTIKDNPLGIYIENCEMTQL
jgi:type IV secretion system protein VirB5